jgi:hypothetical protein
MRCAWQNTKSLKTDGSTAKSQTSKVFRFGIADRISGELHFLWFLCKMDAVVRAICTIVAFDV